VKAALSYDAGTRLLTVKAEQAQQVDARTPAMRISLPIWVRTAGGETVIRLEMRDRTATVTATLDGPPSAAWVDPWLEALKVLEIEQPEAWSLGAMASAPTHAARRQALGAVARSGTPAALAALLAVAGDTGARHTIRKDAIEAIAGLGTPEARKAVAALASSAIADPRVREEAVGALAKADKADAVAACRAILAPAEGAPPERSYAVRARAIDVLAAHESRDDLPLVRTQLGQPSHGESVSQAALRFVARFGDASDVPAVEGRAALGIADRARPAAVDALATLAKRLEGDDRARVEAFLLALVDDPEERTAMSAGAALAELKSKAALARLRAMAEHDRDPARRRRAEGWVKKFVPATPG
jgi:HEAT repeat protein